MELTSANSYSFLSTLLNRAWHNGNGKKGSIPTIQRITSCRLKLLWEPDAFTPTHPESRLPRSTLGTDGPGHCQHRAGSGRAGGNAVAQPVSGQGSADGD